MREGTETTPVAIQGRLPPAARDERNPLQVRPVVDPFRDIRRFQAGTDGEGNPVFSLPLRPDDDGMIGRECPGEECAPAYFKIAGPADGSVDRDSGEDASQITLTCPYCGLAANFQQFHTRDRY